MPRPFEHLTDEELRQALKTMPPRVVKPHQSGWEAVVAWALEYRVLPGRTPALEATDLYRHFLETGYSLGPSFLSVFEDFGSNLNRLGLSKGRSRQGGVDQRPRLMTQDAADYFRGWLELNPRPDDAAKVLRFSKQRPVL